MAAEIPEVKTGETGNFSGASREVLRSVDAIDFGDLDAGAEFVSLESPDPGSTKRTPYYMYVTGKSDAGQIRVYRRQVAYGYDLAQLRRRETKNPGGIDRSLCEHTLLGTTELREAEEPGIEFYAEYPYIKTNKPARMITPINSGKIDNACKIQEGQTGIIVALWLLTGEHRESNMYQPY